MSSPSDSVSSADVHRLAYNALLYSHKDTIAQGYTLWTRGGSLLRVTAFDDYFALTDMITGLEHEHAAHYLMKLDDLKAMEKELRDIDSMISLADLNFLPDDRQLSMELHDADALCFPEGYLDEQAITVIALAPDRLRKLSLLKPSGYPIDLKVFGDPESVIAFRYGPNVRGAMAPEDRQKLMKLYSNGEVWAD